MVWDHLDITELIFRKDNMNTVDKFVNEISQNLANAIVEATKYKVFYEEAQEKLAEAETQLARVNKVLEANEALKELFDETADKLEKED
jgi:hypothetical protein